MVKDSEITVVVSGRIIHEDSLNGYSTKSVLESIRRNLPNSYIILSTWEDERVEGLNFDFLIQTIDPGPIISEKHSHNRQIISSYEGLMKAETPYAIRMRTDTVLRGVSFLDYFKNYPHRNSEYKIFNSRIISLTHFSREPRNSGLLYHPSDIFHFGYTNDVRNFWNANLLKSDSLNFYSDSNLAPEQYFWKNCIERNTPLKITPTDFSILNVINSELFFVNNFTVLNPIQAGIQIPDRFMRAPVELNYSYEQWSKLYNDYCLNLSRFRRLELAFSAGIVKKLRMYLGNKKRKLLKQT